MKLKTLAMMAILLVAPLRADAPFDLLIQLKGWADMASVVADLFVGTDFEYYLRGRADGLMDAYYMVQYAKRLETN